MKLICLGLIKNNKAHLLHLIRTRAIAVQAACTVLAFMGEETLVGGRIVLTMLLKSNHSAQRSN
jgi:hypothetical protein